jgi:hypothetical protein
MVRMQTGPGFRVIVESPGLPGNGILDKGQGRGIALQGVKPQSHCPGPLQTFQKCGIFLPQLPLHSL